MSSVFLKKILYRYVSLGGVYHGAIEVFGEEWSFGYTLRATGVYRCNPKDNPLYTYRESIPLGRTKLTKPEVRICLLTLFIYCEKSSRWAPKNLVFWCIKLYHHNETTFSNGAVGTSKTKLWLLLQKSTKPILSHELLYICHSKENVLWVANWYLVHLVFCIRSSLSGHSTIQFLSDLQESVSPNSTWSFQHLNKERKHHAGHVRHLIIWRSGVDFIVTTTKKVLSNNLDMPFSGRQSDWDYEGWVARHFVRNNYKELQSLLRAIFQKVRHCTPSR